MEPKELKEKCNHKNMTLLNREARRKPSLKKVNVSHYCPDCKKYFKRVKKI